MPDREPRSAFHCSKARTQPSVPCSKTPTHCSKTGTQPSVPLLQNGNPTQHSTAPKREPNPAFHCSKTGTQPSVPLPQNANPGSTIPLLHNWLAERCVRVCTLQHARPPNYLRELKIPPCLFVFVIKFPSLMPGRLKTVLRLIDSRYCYSAGRVAGGREGGRREGG